MENKTFFTTWRVIGIFSVILIFQMFWINNSDISTQEISISNDAYYVNYNFNSINYYIENSNNLEIDILSLKSKIGYNRESLKTRDSFKLRKDERAILALLEDSEIGRKNQTNYINYRKQRFYEEGNNIIYSLETSKEICEKLTTFNIENDCHNDLNDNRIWIASRVIKKQ